jgi:hypothetical protein
LSKLIHNFSLGKSYAMIKTTDHGSHTLVWKYFDVKSRRQFLDWVFV